MSVKPRLLPLVVLGWACAPAPAPKCPEPPAAIRVPEQLGDTNTRTDGAEPTDPAVASPSPGIRPASAFPIPSNCEAPLAITQEVSRLLIAAAAHGTRSAACVDGPGQRLAVNDILVCPAGNEGNDVRLRAFYQVVTYPEGDTRGCGKSRDCSWLEPTASEHVIDLVVRRGADPNRGTLVDPGPLPGFPLDATPLAQPHDGDCYGDALAFVPAALPL